MCNLFATQDPASYECETRAVRLHGHTTSIRLEAEFWAILGEIAGREGLTLARFLCTLHDEVLQRQGDVPNFASMLRVTCALYLRDPAAHAAAVAKRRFREIDAVVA
ncbi:arylsulfate sulfotransferase [Skermanella stibiiresistens SB22]|jgi:predicted DNA-binding ribbon-helix-helix protein|uniref:Arylsulfate sulfotransferase n=1 Tax=Skermanella stibiiresistens SB22 TaxID=1385369 RepID=W9H4K3_9PROT|nr:ribbon-helix-helix domain-containing protein [Skermanella stibiiresistens]EWY39726.1 arylsulfate sulfotransferase [Skermanella stibiiresistens SB22]